MDGHNENNTTNEARRSLPVITFDYELYAHYMDDEDLTEGEKQEFMRSLWNLVVEFMALGFEIHPVQQAQEACGKLIKSRTNPPISGPDAVDCKGSILATEFNDAASGIAPEAAERIQK
jgi:hypothetical protein